MLAPHPAPQARERYRERCATLITNIFTLNRLTNAVQSLHQRLRPVLAQIGAESARQHDGSVDQLRNRIAARIQHLRDELGPPARVTFDANGVAKLSDWRPHIMIGHAELTITTNEEAALTIRCAGGNAPTISSWRSRVELPRGRYRFEAKVRTEGLVPIRGVPGGGVLLRVFGQGSSPPNTVLRNGEWQELTCELTVSDEEKGDEVICEVRGYRGVASFANNSLRMKATQTTTTEAE